MIFDVEGNGLWPTKFHVLSYSLDNKIYSITNHDEMREWLLAQKVLIGHNIIRWDIPNLERVLQIKIEAKLIDTLGLSWYLYDDRNTHNLEDWGVDLGVEKPKIKNWDDLPLEEYIHRCEEDVRITNLLVDKQFTYLRRIYNCSISDVPNLPIVGYLAFKLDCAREQERSRWRVDLDKVTSNIDRLTAITSEQREALKLLMPRVPKYDKKTYPLKPFKKNGELSVQGEKWQKYISDQGLTKDHRDPILVLTGYEDPNPASSSQMKEYLFSLGWKPLTFKYVREDNGRMRAIPQIKKLMEPELCDSVKELIEQVPELQALEGFTIGLHRITVLKGFLRDEVDGFLSAKVSGFTNTLRFIHKEIVNVPKVDSLFGQLIRECLVAREGYELCGSDMTALEDLTKRHYMFPHDPEFVKEMSHPNYDPHMALAAYAKAIPEFDLDDIDEIKRLKKECSKIRASYKETNYSATYGVKEDTLSRRIRSSKPEAKKLLDDFWKKNWSIKAIAAEQKVKVVDRKKWLYNPVSKFYYSLREEKDRFSTLNQGTGVYCFDSWIREIRKQRPQLTGQFHDEIIIEVKKGNRDKATELLQNAIKRVNERLKLNVELSIDIKYGDCYADIH
jgi:hypothetical protein